MKKLFAILSLALVTCQFGGSAGQGVEPERLVSVYIVWDQVDKVEPMYVYADEVLNHIVRPDGRYTTKDTIRCEDGAKLRAEYAAKSGNSIYKTMTASDRLTWDIR